MASIISAGSIDVTALVQQLMIIERQPLTALTTKESSYQSKLSALGLIKSNVSNFQTALQALGSSSSSSFLAFKATPSDTSVFTASADSSATAGIYSLDVTQLAQAHKLAAAGQVSDTAAIAGATASTATFVVGTTSTDVAIPANASLQDIRTAINNANIGVTASIVNDGSGTPYRLALSADNTGVSNKINSITIQAGGDSAINDLLAYNPTTNAPSPAPAIPMAQTVAAQNAEFTLNGIAVSKDSNTVTDAIQGVSFTLSKQTTTTATLTIARDTADVSDKVAAFVKAYNDLYGALKNSSAYKSKSALEGDSTIRTFMTDLRGIASAAVSGGTMANFYEVGITFTSTGTMQLDSAKLSNAMSTDFNDVANLFNSATGYATQFNEWATNALSVGGTFDTKTSSINQSIESIGTRKEALERQMTLTEQRYTQQFSALNVLLGKMNQTSAYIAQQLTKLQ